MDKIKRVICVESVIKHTILISLLKDKYPDIQIITSLDMLEEKISSNTQADITIVFLDNAFLSKVNKELQYQFNYDNNICIVISETSLDFVKGEHYIYDILEYKNISTVQHFLKRLEKDIDYRVQLLSATSEVREFYRIGQKLISEKNVNELMELIIDSSMKLTSADAGSLYIIVKHEEYKNDEWSFYEKSSDDRYLKFIIAKNKSIDLRLKSSTIPIHNDNIVGYAVLNGQPIRIDDAYNISSRLEYKFNPKFDDLTGYKTKSILTVPMKDHQNRILGVIQLINKKKNGEITPFTFKDEVTIYSLAGQASIALENNSLYKDMENLIERYRQTINDEITKQRQTDEELNKLLSAIEHSPSTVVITDRKGNIQYVNPKFTELTGYDYKEVMGKNPRILNSGYYKKDFYNQYWATILSGKEWRGEFRNKKKNGEIYWESASISSLKDSNGEIKYFIAVKEDVTEKKLMSEQIKNKNKELEEALDKLKRTQAKLIQKEKMVGIGQLASGIAHEINNPLGFILSNTRTLNTYMAKFRELLLLYKKFIRDSVDFRTAEQLEQFDQIRRREEESNLDFLVDDIVELFDDTNDGLERVKKIVDALRLFSAIDQLNDFEEYDLNQGIKNSLLILNHEIDNSISVHEKLGNIPHFKTVGVEMNQVILGLISNSIYAIKQKDCDNGKIDIRTWNEENRIICVIEDNGVGIKEENIKDIFNPFFTTKPEGEGIGLGLSIAYDVIVKRHNGEILVNSDIGKGTKFTLKLPLKS